MSINYAGNPFGIKLIPNSALKGVRASKSIKALNRVRYLSRKEE
jgi:hypothetical protein